MALEVVTRFLSEVVRFLSCSALWCALAQMANATFGVTQTAYVIPPTPIGANPLHYVAAADAETLVVTFAVGSSHDPACDGGFHSRCLYREIAKVGPAGVDEPVRVRIPVTPRSTWTVESLSCRLRKFDDVLSRFCEGDSGEKLFEISSGELPLEGLRTLRVVVLKAEQVVFELTK